MRDPEDQAEKQTHKALAPREATPTMDGAGAEKIVKAYLDAFGARDLSTCLACFDESASIKFAGGVFKGKAAIEEWHKDRFEADLRIVRIDRIFSQGEMVHIEGIITSKNLRAWKINALAGTVSVLFQDGRIKDAEFSQRLGSSLKELLK